MSCLLAVAACPGDAGAAGHTEISVCSADQNVPEAVATRLDAMLAMMVGAEAETATTFGYAPGSELYVNAPDWTYHRSTGIADVEMDTQLECGRPFQIGSNTKMMAAAVLMMMVEEQQMSLDDPLSAYFPAIAAALPYGDKITIRQLANHTSGVFSYTDNAPNGAPGLMEGALNNQHLLSLGYSPDDLIRFVIENGEPSFEPGTRGAWAYSNTGYILIGMILEKIAGMPLGEIFEKRIFAPLGMNDSFLWNDTPRTDFGLPKSYYERPFKIDVSAWNMSQGWAAGGVISTADDMDLFIRGLLSGRLFSDPKMLALMMETVPAGAGFAGYGIGIGSRSGGFWGHGGQTLGFESDIGLFHEQDISLVVWANSGNNLAGLGSTIALGALGEANALTTQEDSAQSLAATKWIWVSSKDAKGEESLAIAEPQRYGVFFEDSGDLALQADCNSVLGSFAAHGEDLSIELGPSTKALCTPGSLHDKFVQDLQKAIRFRRDGESLHIFLGQDGGSMEFSHNAE
ncbi:serine hydrolase [Primorskyibacter sp. 2E233]|uniref:serine hydrolase n=1 Tax=Primorskyibacter sp. 2E233 TaxID=3413431 RepID=UPI003BF238F5